MDPSRQQIRNPLDGMLDSSVKIVDSLEHAPTIVTRPNGALTPKVGPVNIHSFAIKKVNSYSSVLSSFNATVSITAKNNKNSESKSNPKGNTNVREPTPPHTPNESISQWLNARRQTVPAMTLRAMRLRRLFSQTGGTISMHALRMRGYEIIETTLRIAIQVVFPYLMTGFALVIAGILLDYFTVSY